MTKINSTQLLQDLLLEVQELKTMVSLQKPLRRIRMPELEGKVGFCSSKIYNMIGDGDFPRPQKDGSTALWFEHDIDNWMLSRKNKNKVA